MTHSEYLEYLKSERWRRKAGRARAKSGHRCQLCNKARNLQVHHRSYDRIGHEAISDLTVLCEECHRTHHTAIPKYTEYLLTKRMYDIVEQAELAYDCDTRTAAKVVFGFLKTEVARIQSDG